MPKSEAALQSLVVMGLYIVGIISLIVLPLEMLSAVAYRAGTIDHGVLHLSPLGSWLLLVVVSATFAGSIVVGGFAKAFFTSNHLGWLWLILFGLAMLIALTTMFDQMRVAMGAFAAVHAGDNPKVTAFIAFWLLMVGYAAKAVWDEARDRSAKWVKSVFDKFGIQLILRPITGMSEFTMLGAGGRRSKRYGSRVSQPTTIRSKST
ncbi:hypothetical protein [Sphingobium sp. B12D2B]|uniref:hypothetical protein n=1 Tax=Sphingobium sp. B12D2B TaxID=2940577 RepID=UPI0022246875|nr:hypothetical protein [Sphingobium sp. B12D2B]MCW2351764.1 hypothetical protein [Sphingobium sp. B12D2B]